MAKVVVEALVLEVVSVEAGLEVLDWVAQHGEQVWVEVDLEANSASATG